MDTQAITSIVVGLGMIAGMWRLTREVASLASTMRGEVERRRVTDAKVERHDERLHSIELEIARVYRPPA